MAGGGSKMVLFSQKIPINGRTVPGIVYNLNRKIRGLIDSSHTGLKVSINFLTLGSTLMAGGRVKNGPFSPKMPRRIRGLTDSSHTGLNNFSPTRSPPSWQGRPKMVLFGPKKGQ